MALISFVSNRHEFMIVYDHLYKEVMSSSDPHMTLDWMARHLNIKLIRSRQSWHRIDALELDDEMITFIILQHA